MIETYSRFYYGFEITPDNQVIDFKEGSGAQLTATIQIGSYTATSLAREVKTALDAAGNLTYSVTFNRATRRITIAASGPFTLLPLGNHQGANALPLMGFSVDANTSSASSHVSEGPAGDLYAPQIWLQEYIPTKDFQQAVDARVSKTATGDVEVIKFGTEKFMECNIKWQTSIEQIPNIHLRSNPTGEEDLRRFLQFLVTKAPVEFMPDENAPEIFETLLLESTPESQDGVGYRMKEMWDLGFNGYFQTGRLKFRKIEERF